MRKALLWLFALASIFSGLGLVLAPAYAQPEVAPTICSKMFLFSNTDTFTAGYTETNPYAGGHYLWAASYSDGQFVKASSTSPVMPPWVNPATHTNFKYNPGAYWISTSFSHPGEPNGEGDAHADQWRLFRKNFALPADATVTNASIYYTADNAASVYLNDKLLGATPATTYGPVPNPMPNTFSTVYQIPFKPVVGKANELGFVVRNYAFSGSVNPTGLIYKVEINYCQPNPVLGQGLR